MHHVRVVDVWTIANGTQINYINPRSEFEWLKQGDIWYVRD